MALFQSAMAARRETPPSGYVHGARMVAISSYTFTQDFTAATDKLELGLLPADTRAVRATLIGQNTGATNATMGLMSGEPGDMNDARTVGNEFFAAQAVNNAEVAGTVLACLNIAPSDKHRGIGVTLSANVTAGTTKKLTLVLEYIH
ncbi:hypothetical protein [Roseinatronobacter sp. NSM]|uniref:hypothetical protein n=1 Tax=Roseinatronobacter sp. NSM TaxID=3457785 RepID=UPI004035F630